MSSPFRPRIICAWEVGPVRQRHTAAWNSRSLLFFLTTSGSRSPSLGNPTVHSFQFVLCLKSLIQLFNGSINYLMSRIGAGRTAKTRSWKSFYTDRGETLLSVITVYAWCRCSFDKHLCIQLLGHRVNFL